MATTHTTNLRAAAQLVSILGRQLIDENAVGLLELVKNGYDADATSVKVTLDNLKDPERTQIVVHDNGFGMDIDDVLGKWMVAGYSHKADEKLRMQRTTGGRLPLGQMGIGRFATARIGKKLIVCSHKIGKPEVLFEIQWDDFDGVGDVGDVEISVTERDPKFFHANESGTRLSMVGAPDGWLEKDVKVLHHKLLRMISPLHQIDNFKVELVCREFPQYQKLDPMGVIDNFHYQLIAAVSASGSAHITVRDKLAGVETSQDVDLWKKVSKEHGRTGSPPACGPFDFELRGWKLRKAELDVVHIKDKTLVQELAGVSLFRDSFRILPYGDPGNDWLELNRRRVNNPTERFSTNQVIGLVDISTADNPLLLDQANRLGLQQNLAFDDLRSLIVAAVSELESRTLGAARSIRDAARASATKEAVDDFQRTLERTRALRETVVPPDNAKESLRPSSLTPYPGSPATSSEVHIGTSGATAPRTATATVPPVGPGRPAPASAPSPMSDLEEILVRLTTVAANVGLAAVRRHLSTAESAVQDAIAAYLEGSEAK